jgi:RNA polymerase sigma factor (sigma-70 family)
MRPHPLHSLSSTDLEAYDRVLRNTARRLTNCDQFADEIAQEVWLEAFRRPPRHLENLGGWFRVAAWRTASRLRRGDARRRRRELITARHEHVPSFTEQFEVEVLLTRVRRAIGELDDSCREVTRLHLEEGLPGIRIAEKLSRSENTVRGQLRRGLAKLRAHLCEDDRQNPALWLGLLLGRPAREVSPATSFTGLLLALGALGVLAFSGRAERAPALAVDGLAGHAAVGRDERPLFRTERRELRDELPSAPSSKTPSTRASQLAVRGRVTEGLRALPGAEVWVATSDAPTRGRMVTHADAEGRFELSGLARTSWIWADASGLYGSSRHQVGSFSAADRDELRLTLHRVLGELTIEVRDHLGAPVADAVVRLHHRDGPGRWSESGSLERLPVPAPARTDADGRAQTDRPVWAYGLVVVEVAGRAWHAEPRGFAKPGLDGALELTLPRPVRVHGRVLDRQGAPAVGVRVRVAHGRSLPPIDTTSDADGRYELPLFSPGAVTLIAGGPDGVVGTALSQVALAAGADRSLDLTLGDEHAITGSVLELGTPLAGWAVEAWPSPVHADAVPLVTRTDHGGEFRFDGAAPGAHSLYLYPPRAAFPAARRAGVEHGQRLELSLDDGPPLHRVTGQLRIDPRAQARADEVRLRVESVVLPVPFEVAVDPEGRFALEALAAGSYELWAVSPPEGPHLLGTFTLADGAELDLGTLVLPQPASLMVQVLPRDGRDPAFNESGLVGASLRLVGSRRDRRPGLFEVDRNTQFFPRVPPGEYVLHVRMRTHATEVLKVRLGAGESRVLTLEPPRGRRVTLELSTGAPLLDGETLHVEATFEGSTRDLTPLLTAAGAKGRTRLAISWGEGVHELNAWSSTGRTGRLLLEVGPGCDGRLEVLALR